MEQRGTTIAIRSLIHVAQRWKIGGEMLAIAERANFKGEPSNLVKMVWASWSFPCAELLRQLLWKRKRRLDCDEAFRLLNSLDNPDLKICKFLAA
jgi:hypothetical protein